MKPWKILGYCFAGLGAIVFCYGFTVGIMNSLDPAKIWSMASSGTTVDFFSVFWSEIAGWTILAVALLIVGGIGLFVGRNPKHDKRSSEERIAELEENLAIVNSQLDEIKRKQNPDTF